VFLESLIQEPTGPLHLSRDLKVCAFELSVALQRRFNDSSAVFTEVNKVDNLNCCFSTWVRLDRDVKRTSPHVGLSHHHKDCEAD